MSKVIKSGDWSNLQNNVRVQLKPACLTQQLCSDAEAANEVQGMLDKARQEAEIIIRTARGEAQSIHDQAYAEGYKAGIETGTSEAAKVADELIRRLEHDIEQAAVDKRAIIEATEPDLLKLIIELVEKIVRHEVKTNPRVIARTIQSCLRRIQDSKDIVIRVNPQEIAQVKAMRDELLGMSESVPGVNFVEDRRVSRGGCVVETSSGDYDARIDTQIDRVCNKLEETLDNECHRATS